MLTSRNFVPPVQRFLANLNTDLIASWEGGSNQLLVRAPGRVLEHRTMVLARKPERRTMLWTRVTLAAGQTLCVANLHASAGLPTQASGELLTAAALAIEWAAGDPLVFGGDLNVRPERTPAVFTELRTRFDLGDPTAPGAIDHLLVRGLDVMEPPRRLRPEERELPAQDGRRLRLSDHAPVIARFEVR